MRPPQGPATSDDDKMAPIAGRLKFVGPPLGATTALADEGFDAEFGYTFI